MLIAGGQSGSRERALHDQFPHWYEGRPLYQPFSDVAEAGARKQPDVKPAP